MKSASAKGCIDPWHFRSGFRRESFCQGHEHSAPTPYMKHMTKVTVWYDGACPLCRREIGLMQRLDRKGAINFVDATSSLSNCPIDRADLLKRFHAQENGVMLTGAAAFAAMWRAIPILRPLGVAARLPWVLAVLERGYRLFLQVRPQLQRFYATRTWKP